MTEAAETEAPETEAVETEAPETEAPETEAPETEALETEEAEEEAMAALGHIEGNEYTNDTFGLHMTAESPWVIANEEEMAQIRGIAAESVDDEELAQQLLDSGTVYDLFVQNTSTSANVNVVLQDVGLFGGLAASNTSSLIDNLIPEVESAYKSAGYDLASIEKSTITFIGEETPCIATSFSTQGIEMKQRQIYRINGRYLAVITFTAVSDEDLDEACALFD